MLSGLHNNLLLCNTHIIHKEDASPKGASSFLDNDIAIYPGNALHKVTDSRTSQCYLLRGQNNVYYRFYNDTYCSYNDLYCF